MLILARKIRQSIYVGNDIIFTILGVQGNTVRVGIKAPSHIPVHREEVWLKVQDEQAEAVAP